MILRTPHQVQTLKLAPGLAVDPPQRAVTVHVPGAAPRVLAEGDVLEGGDVVPGFRCTVAELFEGVARD